MTARYYPYSVTVSKDAADKAKRDLFHEAAFLAALQGLCANPAYRMDLKAIRSVRRNMQSATVAIALLYADAALDQYPFITDDTQLKKGNTK